MISCVCAREKVTRGEKGVVGTVKMIRFLPTNKCLDNRSLSSWNESNRGVFLNTKHEGIASNSTVSKPIKTDPVLSPVPHNQHSCNRDSYVGSGTCVLLAWLYVACLCVCLSASKPRQIRNAPSAVLVHGKRMPIVLWHLNKIIRDNVWYTFAFRNGPVCQEKSFPDAISVL